MGAITGNMGEGENGAIAVIFRPIINRLDGEWLQLRSGGNIKKKKKEKNTEENAAISGSAENPDC